MIYTIYLVDNNNTITETISLDVVNNFGEDYSSSIAQNTVESGYIISDSISINNPKFAVSGVITDSKFRTKGHLVVFNGNSFEKSQGDSREQFQQISDDDYAEKVKNRLIKIWENKEIFGILESKDINNVKGTQVRDIFPCVLSNLSFTKSDASAAIYPSLAIEKIRYAVVTIGAVTNPTPELISKYEESIKTQSTTSAATATTSDNNSTSSVASEIAKADAEAKKVLKGVGGQEKTTSPQQKTNLVNLNRTAQASGQAQFNNLDEKGRAEAVKKFGSEYNAVNSFSEKIFNNLATSEGYSGATFEKR